MKSPSLTIFYDSLCPLCVAEMKKLQAHDINHHLAFISLQDEKLLSAYPNLNRVKAMNILQGQLSDGQFIQGLDVTHKAWSLIGKAHYTRLLRWPVIKLFFDVLYLVFAKHRYQLSSLITGKKYTDSKCCPCSLKRTKGMEK